MKRQKQILFVLVIVLVIALLYSWWSTPRQETIVADNVSGKTESSDSMAANIRTAVDLQKVNLELLKSSRKSYRGYKRDVFNYYVPKPVKVEPKPVKVESKPVEKPQQPVVSQQVRKQLSRFTFLGFLEKDATRTVFLSKTDELFLVKQGDYFGEENQFEVVEINDEKMAIRQAGASGLIEIVLKEEEPLIPSFFPGDEAAAPAPNQTIERSSSASRSGGEVPPSERHRKWFKDAQPTPVE